MALVVFPIAGFALIGFGLSGLLNASALATRGVPVVARVSATDGYGSSGLQLAYSTVNGQGEHGTVSGVDRSAFHMGEPVPAVYDPDKPTVVSLAGGAGNPSNAEGEVAVGSLFLAIVALSLAFGTVSARRSHRRRVRAVMGL